MIVQLLACVVLAAPPVNSLEELRKLLGEEYDLLDALDQLDDDRKLQEKLLSENKIAKLEVEERLAAAVAAHNVATENRDVARKTLRKRMRVFRQLNRLTEERRDWKLLASSDDIAKYLRKRRLFKLLMEADQKSIHDYQQLVAKYQAALDEKLVQEAEKKAVELRISNAISQLERDKAIKLALLDSIRNDKDFFGKAARDLDKAAASLQKSIDNFEEWTQKRLWFRDLKGQYLFPLPGGTIGRGFGKQTHPIHKTVTMHRGMTFEIGKKGVNKVRVVYWGRVVYAGPLKGFGNTVIVDHTKRDYTLYAHLKHLDVKVGDVIKSREVIGTVGKSGSFDGQKLYFELRMDGKPVNPRKWFRR